LVHSEDELWSLRLDLAALSAFLVALALLSGLSA